MSFVDQGFIDAVSTWNEYRTGSRPWGWGPFAAKTYFEKIGLDLPSRPPTQPEQVAMRSIMSKTDAELNNPRAMKSLSAVLRYLTDAFDTTEDELDNGPADGSPATPLDALDDVMSEYTHPPQPPKLEGSAAWPATSGDGCFVTDESQYDIPDGPSDGTNMVRSMTDEQIYDMISDPLHE